MAKELKTNAMRILDSRKIPYTVNLYTCDEFIDGVHIADQLGQPYESSFKTLVAVGKSGEHYVFVLPIAEELDFKKCAQAVGEKAVELIAVKDILKLTGYVRGGCTPIGMKKLFPTVIHESAKSFDTIIISGGRIGAQIMLSPMDLATVTNARFGDLIR
ncbi:MAG: Cys-tRNA(Pro) deacylase [Eubacteriales bacterium]